MLFDKYNIQFLQELDERAATNTPKVDSLDNAEDSNHKKNIHLLKIIGKKCEEITFLNKKVNKTVAEKNALSTALKTKDQELQDANKNYRIQNKELNQIKVDLGNSLKEIKLLQNKLREMDRLKEKQNMTNNEKAEILNKCSQLEQGRVTDQIRIQKLQEFIVRHFKRLGDTIVKDSAYHDLVRRHVILQKEYDKKIKDLGEKQFQLKEKDERIAKLINMGEALQLKEHMNKLIESKRKIKMQATSIKVLTAQLNICESAVASYKNELNETKQKLKTKLS
ncbi:uncharacterized protein NPIL_595421 [Nephila pilipes]|uniref:Uncharacterized protein n=1 Tax=Nephila pilipes TaxID=299642 RepID=A0A8X6N0X4_NEPPI|nr:uncharacterized protein NPIL_595421 [Nephila pilipes]